MLNLDKPAFVVLSLVVLYTVVDFFDRVVIGEVAAIQKNSSLPVITVHENSDDVVDKDGLINSYTKFDFLWQQNIKSKEESLTELNSLNSDVRTISIIAIFNELKPFAIAHVHDHKNKLLHKEKLFSGDTFEGYKVKSIDENSVTVEKDNKSTQLILFKANNSITLNQNDDLK